ncbi:MAG: Zn-dependent protease with chaperone function [Candidatus Poriferisodalaceae bacterium]|jgi:Zn-dependent protease with chaperone function
MDFQGHQDDAKQKTGRLVAYFVAGMIAIIAIVSLLIGGLLFSNSGEVQILEALAVSTPLTIIAVGGASLVKSSQIRSGGGSYIATSMGGRQIDFNTLDPAERQLANVVEEMAIASGMPVPEVFILDEEPGINAFAAGWTADNAAIGVTRGALDNFTRRELQGVIAHEFSHIANGDTRVKTRIIGWVFGISILTVLGRILLEIMFWRPRSRNSKDNSTQAIALLGFGLLIIGAVGTFFARMIQAAVSRQREFLADASAVQYTRDPSSIGEALIKIGSVGDNKVHAAHATEASHLFFSSPVTSMFATHPPLKQRVKRLMPEWEGDFGHQIVGNAGPINPAASGFAGDSPAPAPAPSNGFQPPTFDGPTDAHIEHSRHLLARIPNRTQQFLRTPQGAVSAVLGSLVSSDSAERDTQLTQIGEFLAMHRDDLNTASVTISSLDRTLQLPAIDIALQAIRRLPWQSQLQLATVIRKLEESDTDEDVFRWVLRRVMLRHLEDQRDDGRMRHDTPLEQARDDAVAVLAMLAHHNSSGAAAAESSFAASLGPVGVPDRPLPPLSELTFDELDGALERLSHLDRTSRQHFVKAATAIVLHDDTATAEEAELLRVVADAVRLPVPPLLPN